MEKIKFLKQRKKYPNIIQCLQCNWVLVSNYRHDYKTCDCLNQAMIDGGYDYLRCGGKDMSKIQVLRVCGVKDKK